MTLRPLRRQALPALAFLVILAAALALRLHEITRAFWIDEAWTHWFAHLPWRMLWVEVPTYETHPPFYYSLVKLLLPLGESELALRLFPVVCSLLILPLAWRIMVEMPDRRGAGLGGAGLLAAAFCALCAAQVSLGQEARPYAPLALAATLLLLLGNRWLGCLADGGTAPQGRTVLGVPPGLFIGFVLTGAVTCWLHFVAGLYVAAVMIPLGLAALAHPARWRALGALALAAALILVLILPYLHFLTMRSDDWTRDSWMAPLTLYRARVILLTLLGPAPLPRDSIAAYGMTMGVLLLAAWGLVVVLRRAGWQRALLLASCAGFPVVLAIGASIVSGPVFVARTMLPVTVPVFLLMAAAVWGGLTGVPRWGLAGILVALFAAGAIAGYPERKDEPHDQLAARLIAEAGPDDPILIEPNISAVALEIYLRRAGARRNLRPMPAPYPAIGLPNRYPFGTPALPLPSEADIAAMLADTAGAPVVWLFERNWESDMRRALAAVRPVESDTYFGDGMLRLTRFGPLRRP